MAGFSQLCKKLEKSFNINGKAKSTLTNYTRCLAHMACHTKVNPIALDQEAVEDYLHFCKNQHQTPSDSFFKHTIYGLRAAYKVMQMPERKIALPQIKRQNDLPIVLSKQEVRKLIRAPKYLKHKLIIAMLYGCGLRSYELCNLEIKHIDFDRKTVFIKKQKGNHDRYLPLSELLCRGLKKYLSTVSPQKWIFNSQVSKDGRDNAYTTRGIQWTIKEARSKIKTSKKITAHTLRHTYATHLLEDGLDIVSIKELLGHARIETTLVYLHVAKLKNKAKYSPLDTLYNL